VSEAKPPPSTSAASPKATRRRYGAVTTTTPDPSAFRAAFLEEFEEYSLEIEATDRIPDGMLRRVAEIGAYRLTIPTEYGGLGLNAVDYQPYLEVAAMGTAAGRMLVHVTNGLWRPLVRYGKPEQQRIVTQMAAGEAVVAFALTEKTGGPGSDLHSRAERSGSSWRISGEKHLITFADRADWFILFAASDDRRKPDSMTAFLVPRDTPGFEIDATQETMGLHGTGHAWLRYEGIEVSDELRLGEVGQGQELVRSFLTYSILSLTTCMVGLSQRALDEAVAYTTVRTTFGKPVSERQVVQAQIANMAADIAAGRSLVRALAAGYDASGPKGVEAFAATAKLFCLNMVGRVTDASLRCHGGFGYTKQALIERIYRDARGFWFEEGTQEIQQLIVGRDILARA
jgi:alkylation response protein AidB-like acyl-CoA dehydrogenase